MRGFIFAAGKGTRLRPITDTMPKALVPVEGVPMLGRILEKLSREDFDEIVVNAWYFREQIVDYIASHKFNLPVKVCVENGPEPRETGGGIKYAEPFLKGCGKFFVHNTDMLSNLDIKWFLSQVRDDALSSLLVVDAPADRYLLFDDDMRLVGWTNVKTGAVLSPYENFDPSAYHKYSFCGVHCIDERIFPMLEGWEEVFGIIKFYMSICDKETIRGILAPDGFSQIDIGSPETLAQAQEYVRNQNLL